MSNTTQRRTVIEKLLAKIKPGNEDKLLGQLESYLDRQGIDRKEFDGKKAKGVLEEAVTGINEALAPLSDEIPEDLAPKILALVMGTLADMPVMPEEEVVEVETMAEGEDEEEEMPEAMLELSQQVKTLADDNIAMVKDFEALVKAVVEMADGYKTVAPLINKADEYQQMANRLVVLEKAMSMTPRRASTAEATVVDKPEIEKEIKKGTDGKQTVFGLPVKE